MLQLLNSLFESGLHDQLLKAGIISPKYSTYRDMYFFVDAHMKTRGLGKEEAVTAAEVQFNVGRTTIYKALRLISPIN